jgi:hypothetical protein
VSRLDSGQRDVDVPASVLQNTQRRFRLLNKRLEAAVAKGKQKAERAKHVPVATFVTFEEEEGFARCLKVRDAESAGRYTHGST